MSLSYYVYRDLTLFKKNISVIRTQLLIKGRECKSEMYVYLFSKDFLIVYCVANNQIVKSFLFRVSAFRHSLNENPAPFGAIFLSIVIAACKERKFC